MKYPKKLKRGDTIGLVCPSSPITKEQEEAVAAAVEAMGFHTKTACNLTEQYGGYMAGSGLARAEWINKMFADKDVDAVFCVRGGYGSARITEYLDLNVIRDNPKVFVGYSDVTSIHTLITQQCGFVTFHGPMAAANIEDFFSPETRASFFDAINSEVPYIFHNPDDRAFGVLKEGKAEGMLTGGNLALLSAGIGTPYEIDTKGKILFLEEIGENMGRIDRYLYHLRNAGKLAQCKGILLGQFTDCENTADPQYRETECLADALEGMNIPVMYGIQSGHGHPMMTLPFGAVCTMDTAYRQISFEAPKHLKEERLL